MAVVDLSTGEFNVAEYGGPDGVHALRDEIAVIQPREIVVAGGHDIRAHVPEVAQRELPVTEIEGWHFELETARQAVLEQLRVSSLEGFGLERRQAAVCAAGALLRYLRDTQKADLAHVRTVRLKQSADGLLIDPTTLEHLEVVESTHGGRQGSLLHEIDRTITSMGGRLLRAWLLRPLVSIEAIRDRLDAVEELAFRTTDRGKLRETLKTVQDLERLTARVALSTAGPRDLIGLRQSLAAVPRVRVLLQDCQAPLVKSLVGRARRTGRRAQPGSRTPSTPSRRRWPATVGSSATASTARSTSFGTSRDPANRSSRSSRIASAPAPASSR